MAQTMNIASLTNSDKAELIARLCAIDVVTWRWNARGWVHHLFTGSFAKLRNRVEIGVIAQNVHDELGPYFPDITDSTKLLHVMRVNYGFLANVASAVLPRVDEQYRLACRRASSPVKLNLSQLLQKYETLDPQLAAARLIALVQNYQTHIDSLSTN